MVVNKTDVNSSSLANYIFNVMKDSSIGQLIVAETNGMYWGPPARTWKIMIITRSPPPPGTRFQQVYYNAGGFLAVDVRLLDVDGATSSSRRRQTAYPTATVGGNRYGILAFINNDGGTNCAQEVRVRLASL